MSYKGKLVQIEKHIAKLVENAQTKENMIDLRILKRISNMNMQDSHHQLNFDEESLTDDEVATIKNEEDLNNFENLERINPFTKNNEKTIERN